MTLLIVYVLLVAIAEAVVFALGIAMDTVVPPGWNIVVAMAMFFGVIWLMWPISVFVTERWLIPAKPAEQGASAKKAATSK